MFRNYTLRLLQVGFYRGIPAEAQRGLLPPLPGVYIWTHDVGSIAHQAQAADFPAHLQNRIRPTDHHDEVQVGHYRGVRVFDAPTELRRNTSARIGRLQQHSSYQDLLGWSLLCASIWQRPLYIGRAVNLRGRLRSHLQQGSDATDAMQLAGININECLITMAVLAAPAESSAAPEDNDPDNLDDPDYLLSNYSLSRREVEDLICVAESLMIRQAHPIFNTKMD